MTVMTIKEARELLYSSKLNPEQSVIVANFLEEEIKKAVARKNFNIDSIIFMNGELFKANHKKGETK